MRSHRGWSAIEMLVVVALLAIVVAIATSAWAASRAHVDAAVDLARRIATERWHAVVTGSVAACLPRDATTDASNGVRAIWPARGLTFTPDGLPRSCDGGGVGNTTILLDHRGRRAAVIVSSLGRVRWELR